MTYGLRITNPGNSLVVDAEAMGYRFHSTPSVYSTSYYQSYELVPYVFRVTTSSASDVPVVFIRPQTNITAKVAYVNLVSGSTWDIGVYGVNLVGHSESMRNQAVATPIIHVFSRMTATSETYGLRLYNSAGTLTYDTGHRPLWLKGTLSFPSRSGAYSPYSWVNQAYFNYDSVPFSGYTNMAVLGNPAAFGQVDSIGFTGEPADKWEYGWTLVSGQLARYRFWAGTDKPSYDLNWSDATLSFQYDAMTAYCIEAAGL